jgi:hypothetical protein
MCEHMSCRRSLRRNAGVGATLLVILIFFAGWGWWVAPGAITALLGIALTHRRTHATAKEYDRRVSHAIASWFA